MIAMRFGGRTANGRDVVISEIDWGSVVSVADGGVADVSLLGTFSPAVFEDGLVGLPFLRLNPDCLGIRVSGEALCAGWTELLQSRIPMDKLALGLLWQDIIMMLRGVPSENEGFVHHYSPAVPAYAAALKFAGHMAELDQHPPGSRLGSDRIAGGLRRALNAWFKHATPGDSTYATAAGRAHREVVSKNSELQVLNELLRLGYRCTLSKAGPDFRLAEPGVAVEVKSLADRGFERLLNRFTAAQAGRSLRLTPQSYLALLCWYGFSHLKRAFQEQNASVLVYDISHAFPGPLLMAAEELWGVDAEFAPALESAVDVAGKGKQCVVLFTSAIGLEHRRRARMLERDEVEKVGGALWNLNKALGLDAYGLAEMLDQQ